MPADMAASPRPDPGYPPPVSTAVPARPDASSRVFCAELSSARDEPLAATASRIDHWILVEYRGPWDREVVGQSLLSAELKAHLRSQLDVLPHSRLFFVRQPERRAQPGRAVLFGTSRPGGERFFELEVGHQEELRDFDFVGALAADGHAATRFSGPLFVVCTHGRRDACCARFGRPLYDALRAEVGPSRVWQSTHVGGDRFAGNVVALPHGLYYGRVRPDDVASFAAATAAGRVELGLYRGRSAYSFAVQAAEHAIRDRTGLTGIDDLAFVGVERACLGGQEVTRARFRMPDTTVHEVDVSPTFAEDLAYLTCGSEEPRRARRCLVMSYSVLSP
jgi:hypothetical protein